MNQTPPRNCDRPAAGLLLASAIVVFAGLSTPSTCEAQGLFRRFGDRIRENAQQRINPAAPLNRNPAVAPVAPAISGQRTNARAAASAINRPSAATPSATNAGAARSNYNRPAVPTTNRGAAGSIARQTPSADLTSPGSAQYRARLGVAVETPPPVFVPGRGPRPTRGAAIVTIQSGLGAEAAGLLAGDVIVSVNGGIVSDVDQFRDIVSNLEPGQRVDLRYVRDNALYTATTLMADESGKVSRAQFNDIRALADGNGPARGAQLNASQVPTARSTTSQSGPSILNRTFDDVFSQGFSDPINNAPIDQVDYESFQRQDDSMLVSPKMRAKKVIDPSSSQAGHPMPSTPPKAAKSSAVGELLPPPSSVEISERSLPAPSAKPSTNVDQLKEEVERLRRRLEELEASEK